MSDENIFAEVAPTPAPTAPAPSAPLTLPAEVLEFVGEGKKYKTPEEALKALPHAQAHIAKLELEAKELREKAANARAIEDLYETLAQANTQAPATPNAPVFDERLVDALLDRKLKEQQEQAVQEANLKTVSKALVDKFGDKAQDAFKKKAEEFGVSEAFIKDIVAKSSKAGLELFGLSKQEVTSSSVPAGSINTQALKQNQQPQAPKPVMAGASTGDLLSAWRAVNPLNNT